MVEDASLQLDRGGIIEAWLSSGKACLMVEMTTYIVQVRQTDGAGDWIRPDHWKKLHTLRGVGGRMRNLLAALACRRWGSSHPRRHHLAQGENQFVGPLHSQPPWKPLDVATPSFQAAWQPAMHAHAHAGLRAPLLAEQPPPAIVPLHGQLLRAPALSLLELCAPALSLLELLPTQLRGLPSAAALLPVPRPSSVLFLPSQFDFFPLLLLPPLSSVAIFQLRSCNFLM